MLTRSQPRGHTYHPSHSRANSTGRGAAWARLTLPTGFVHSTIYGGTPLPVSAYVRKPRLHVCMFCFASSSLRRDKIQIHRILLRFTELYLRIESLHHYYCYYIASTRATHDRGTSLVLAEFVSEWRWAKLARNLTFSCCRMFDFIRK